MKKIGKILLYRCGGFVLLGAIFVGGVFFYKTSLKYYVREVGSGEFLTVLNLTLPSVGKDDGRFIWLDSNTVAYETLNHKKDGHISPFTIVNLETLEKHEVDTLPNIKPGRFQLLSPENIEKNREIMEKWGWNGIAEPVVGGMLMFGSQENTYYHSMTGGSFWSSKGNDKCSQDNGLCLVNRYTAVRVVVGAIMHFKASPDGCKAIVRWNKEHRFNPMSTQIGLLRFCKI